MRTGSRSAELRNTPTISDASSEIQLTLEASTTEPSPIVQSIVTPIDNSNPEISATEIPIAVSSEAPVEAVPTAIPETPVLDSVVTEASTVAQETLPQAEVELAHPEAVVVEQVAAAAPVENAASSPVETVSNEAPTPEAPVAETIAQAPTVETPTVQAPVAEAVAETTPAFTESVPESATVEASVPEPQTVQVQFETVSQAQTLEAASVEGTAVPSPTIEKAPEIVTVVETPEVDLSSSPSVEASVVQSFEAPVELSAPPVEVATSAEVVAPAEVTPPAETVPLVENVAVETPSTLSPESPVTPVVETVPTVVTEPTTAVVTETSPSIVTETAPMSVAETIAPVAVETAPTAVTESALTIVAEVAPTIVTETVQVVESSATEVVQVSIETVAAPAIVEEAKPEIREMQSQLSDIKSAEDSGATVFAPAQKVVDYSMGFIFRNTGFCARSGLEFVQDLEQIPLDILQNHLRNGDFEKWFMDVLSDNGSADSIRSIRESSSGGEELRTKIIAVIAPKYKR